MTAKAESISVAKGKATTPPKVTLPKIKIANTDVGEFDGTLVGSFQDTVAQHADAPALSWKQDGAWKSITYREFSERVQTFAHGLALLGISKGDRFALFSRNRPEWAIADQANLHLGGITVPIYDTLTPDKAAYILNDSGAKVVAVGTEELLGRLLEVRSKLKYVTHIIVMDRIAPAKHGDDILHFDDVLALGKEHAAKNPDHVNTAALAIQPTDLCSFVYTSGTTGEPKGVMLSHRNFYSNCAAAATRVDIKPGWVSLSFLPLSHVFERMGGYYLMIHRAGTIAYAESIEKVPQNLLEVKPHILFSVPRLYEKMYAKIQESVEGSSFVKRKIFRWAEAVGRDYMQHQQAGTPVPKKLAKKVKRADKLVYSKLRDRMGGRIIHSVAGGAALSREIEEFFNAVGVTLLPGYGLTETSPVVSVNVPGEHRFGAVGRPIPKVQVRVAEDGEIEVAGPCLMQGYYGKEKDTQDTFTPDGWLKTGDVGRIDEDGYLYITDRKKEIIVMSNGKNVTPQPIENQLKLQPHVAQVVVIGEKRNYMTALIAPNFEALGAWAEDHKIPAPDPVTLVKEARVQDLLRSEVEEVNKTLSRYEQIKKFRLLPRELSMESGELTPTLKVKRRVIDERYATLINEMYA